MLSPEELAAREQEIKARRQARRRGRVRRALFISLCVVLGLALLLGSAYYTYRKNPGGFNLSLERVLAARGSDRVHILVLGSDDGGGERARTDTMMVVALDSKRGTVGVLAIPRDTRVQIHGRQGYDRVNAAHAYGGPPLAVATVQALLGIEVHHYVRLDFRAFEKVVDTVGGVELEVARPMYYVDRAQDLVIDLEPGVQRLGGEKALQYVRFRADHLGDISAVDSAQGLYDGRVERQLQFVQALLREVLRSRAVLKGPQLVAQLSRVIDTDLPLELALQLALVGQRSGFEQVETAVLPGVGDWVGGASYWLYEPALAREVVNRVVLGRDLLDVRVLNGSGRAGIAAEASHLLQLNDFGVREVGNAGRFDHARTQVTVYGSGGREVDRLLDVLAQRTGGAVDVIRAQRSSGLDAEVTVILGKDF